jgi:hypothetical protein
VRSTARLDSDEAGWESAVDCTTQRWWRNLNAR